MFCRRRIFSFPADFFCPDCPICGIVRLVEIMLRKMIPAVLGLCLVFPAAAQKFEAEDGDLYGVTKASEVKGFSGSGYVQFISYDQSCVGVNVNVGKSGDYAVVLNVRNPNEDRRVSFKVEYDDDGFVCAQRLPYSQKFSQIYVNSGVFLDEGGHTLYITGLTGEWQLDSVEIKPLTSAISRKISPPGELVTKNPSRQAAALYKYLVGMRGKGILSGQQIYAGTPEIKVINQTTGKYPAVLGIDLIDFSPSRVEHGTRSSVVREAKRWWDAGGIITCCWHWNAPKDLVNQDVEGKRWYDGFRTGATTFNFVNGLRNHDSEEYRLMLRDIDEIAVQLKSLQEAGIPVLWRPLHEASGGWFWWGAHGKDSYIELYRMLFDRLVNYHKLNNLIWVWNGQNPDWYPGDEYADVISYDSYPGERNYKPLHDELVLIQAATAQPKLVAVSENGALPDIEALQREKSPWSWFCTWNGDFVRTSKNGYSGKFTDIDTFRKFYENDYLITRDELPSFR